MVYFFVYYWSDRGIMSSKARKSNVIYRKRRQQEQLNKSRTQRCMPLLTIAQHSGALLICILGYCLYVIWGIAYLYSGSLSKSLSSLTLCVRSDCSLSYGARIRNTTLPTSASVPASWPSARKWRQTERYALLCWSTAIIRR